MRRILVTGAFGFVGRHLLSALSARFGAAALVGVGRRVPACPPEGIACRAADMRDEAAVSRLVEEVRPTDIVHLAALSSVQQAARAPFETWRANVGGLLNVAEAAGRHAPRCNFVFVSSGEVYGRAFSGVPATESLEPRPAGSYAVSKRAGETMLRDIFGRTDMKLVILRPFNHIGAGQDERFVVSSFARQIARAEAGLTPPVIEVGNLSAERDFLDVQDVVAAYIAVLTGIDAIESGAVFNIGSGLPRTIESVLSDLRSLASVQVEVRIAPDRLRPSEIPVAVGDASLLREATGWRPAIPWTTSLRTVLDDARAQLASA